MQNHHDFQAKSFNLPDSTIYSHGDAKEKTPEKAFFDSSLSLAPCRVAQPAYQKTGGKGHIRQHAQILQTLNLWQLQIIGLPNRKIIENQLDELKHKLNSQPCSDFI
jgi:hypothetical protein